MGRIRKHISPLQAQIHFPDKQVRAALLVAEHDLERTILRIVLALVAFCAVGYVYFVASSTLNVIARNTVENQMSHIESTVGLLEQRALALSKEITPETAASLGLVPVADIAYVHALDDVGFAGATHNAI